MRRLRTFLRWLEDAPDPHGNPRLLTVAILLLVVLGTVMFYGRAAELRASGASHPGGVAATVGR